MKLSIHRTIAFLSALAWSSTSGIVAATEIIAQTNVEGQGSLRASRLLKKDDKKDKNKDDGAVYVVDERPLICTDQSEQAKAFIESTQQGERGSIECLADPVSGCNGGCCRIGSAYFVCDTDLSPTSAWRRLTCVCNDLTGPPPTDPPANDQSLVAGEGDEEGTQQTEAPSEEELVVEEEGTQQAEALSEEESVLGVLTFDPVLVSPATVAPSPTIAPLPNLVEVATAAEKFTTFLSLLVSDTEMTDKLEGSVGTYTIFAPTDSAWPQGEGFNFFLGGMDDESKAAIVNYHIVPGRVSPLNLMHGNVLETVHGKTLDVTVDSEAVRINGKALISAGMSASNGVVYELDGFLIP